MQLRKINKTPRRVISQSKEGGTEAWWATLELATKHVNETGDWEGFSKKKPAFISNTRKKWKEGRLATDQILALKKIKFPLTIQRGANSPLGAARRTKGPLIERAFKLKEKFDAEGLNKNESAEYNKLRNGFRRKYNNGALSEASAKKLGLF